MESREGSSNEDIYGIQIRKSYVWVLMRIQLRVGECQNGTDCEKGRVGCVQRRRQEEHPRMGARRFPLRIGFVASSLADLKHGSLYIVDGSLIHETKNSVCWVKQNVSERNYINVVLQRNRLLTISNH